MLCIVLCITASHAQKYPHSYANVIKQPYPVTLTAETLASYLPTVSSPTPQGFPNRSFGNNSTGTIFVPFNIAGGTSDQITGMTTTPEGKLIVTGSSQNAQGTARYALAQFLPNGQLDTSFGGFDGAQPGTAFLNFGISGAGFNTPYAIALQSDGKIIVAGNTQPGAGTASFALARFLPTGQLDTTFAPTSAHPGTTFLNFGIAGGTTDTAFKVLITPTDKIILTGSSDNGGGQYVFALAQFLPDGQPDTAFGGQHGTQPGTTCLAATIANGNNDNPYASALGTDGSITLAGTIDNNFGAWFFAAARFLPNGDPDTSFGGQNGDPAGTTRFSPFGFNGFCYAIALQSDHKLVLAGTSSDGLNSYFTVARLLANGQVDTAFGGQNGARPGASIVNFSISGTAPGGISDEAHAVALQPNGAILLSGFTNNVEIGRAHV